MTIADQSSASTLDIVDIRVPADGSFVSTLRITAASLAARCELTIDDIEDVRLAVDEACSLLLPHAAADTAIDARFALGAGHLEVSAAVTTDGAAEPDRDGFGWTLLGALTDSVDVRAEAGRLTITVGKDRQAAAGQ